MKIAAGFMMRFGSHVMSMKKAIAEGKIGTVVSGYSQFTLWLPYEPGNWRQCKAKAGGGAMMDLSVHTIDLMEYITGMRVTEAFTREGVNCEIFEDTNDDIRHSWIRAIKLNNLFWPSLDTVSAIGTVLVYIFGVAMLGPNVAAGEITVGTLLLILWYLGRFWEPLNNLANFYNNVLVAMASTERIFEILDTAHPDRLQEGCTRPAAHRGSCGL